MIKKLFPFILIIFISCSGNSVPSGVLDPEEMYPVMKDILITDEYINTYLLRDSTLDVKRKRSELYEKVFALHKITRKDYYNSYKYYQQHPNVHKVLFDSLSENLKRKDTTKVQVKREAIKP